MSSLRIEFQNGSVHLPELGLWLDPHEPLTGPEMAFVSHAHSDHIAAHREVILSAPTSRLMQARVPGARLEHVLDFGATRRLGANGALFDITLLPAGHIFGSAMSLIQVDGNSLLYSGDFKLRRSLSAEACEPRPSDILIMETTYGRAHYSFPPTEEVLKGVIRFCREALDNDETPVLLGYSLGKSQELLCGLGDTGFPLMLHGTVYRLTKIYEQFGQCFPKYEGYKAGSARGKVLVCPPNVTNSAMLRNLGKSRTAILTGWAVDPNCRYRYRCDAAFPLSDHADFPDLVNFVNQVKPKKVYTLHGFAAEFAQHLRQLGYDAQALSENEQFTLGIDMGKTHKKKALAQQISTAREASPASNQRPLPSASDPFLKFAVTCQQISLNSSKLEKIRLLADHLRSLQGDAIGLAATWFTGRPFPSNQNKVLQLGWAVIRDALCTVGEIDEASFSQIYLKHSDLGEAAQEVLQAYEHAPSLTVGEINELFQKLHAARGPLAKAPILTQAFERSTPLEARYLVKIITGDLRIGLKEGLVEEAVATAFARSPESIRQANLLIGDIGETAQLAAEDKLGDATIKPFRPVKFMLASPEATAGDIWDRVREWTDSASAANAEEPSMPADKNSTVSQLLTTAPSPLTSPSPSSDYAELADKTVVWLEDKYDGVRCQLHKVGNRVALYSRDLKDITNTFLELSDSISSIAANCILDGEVIAMRGDDVLPFAELQKRLGRKQADLFMREEIPIKFVAFDILWQNGMSCLNVPLRERRHALESLTSMPECFRLARITEATSIDEIEAAFTAARERGNEGLMIKDPASLYAPGRRGLAWLKLKKAYATLDCVVIGAEYGHGKRRQVLSDYTFAVRDERSGELKTIGKAYSGLTDVEIAQLTEHFLKTALRQHGRYFEVPPDTVLEIAFDRIQPSNRHSSGLALRFPRIVRIRTDKSVAEIDTLENARKLANGARNAIGG